MNGWSPSLYQMTKWKVDTEGASFFLSHKVSCRYLSLVDRVKPQTEASGDGKTGKLYQKRMSLWQLSRLCD